MEGKKIDPSITKDKNYTRHFGGKDTFIRKIRQENPLLSMAEACSIYMKQLRDLQTLKRELQKDFAPERAAAPYKKMVMTRAIKHQDKKRRTMADMDIIERAEKKRRERKGLLPLRDQVMIPLNNEGSITASKVLNNISDEDKPASIKEAFVDVFNELQTQEHYSLLAWAKLNTSQFYLLITKLIPQQSPDTEKPISIKSITFE